MRVAVVSTPRTCSSFLGNIMSQKYKLRDYSEIFSYGDVSEEKGLEKLKIINENDNFSIKITSTSFFSHEHIISPQRFPWERFDKIILAERKDLSQQVASWMLLNHAQNNGNFDHSNLVKYLTSKLLDVKTIPFVNHEFKEIIRNIKYFYEILKPHLVKNFGEKVKVVTYELLQNEPVNYIIELNQILQTNFDIEDVIDKNTKTELDYTPFIDYYNLGTLIEEHLYATKEENSYEYEGPDPTEGQGII